MKNSSNEIRWLHISDLHFKADDPYDRDRVLNALLSSLPKLIDRFGAIDLVFVTGDIAFSGKVAEYLRATVFFDRLLSLLSLKKDRIFFVPGNHDIDRTKGKGLTRTLSTLSESDGYFNLTESCVHIEKKLAAYADWYNSYYEGFRTFVLNSSYNEPVVLDFGHAKLAIAEINSAVFAFDDHDSENLWLGRRAMENLCSALEVGAADIKIALMHHPLNYLSNDERQTIKSLFQKNFHFLLSGHLHVNDPEIITGISGKYISLASGATYQTTKFPNKFLICTLQSNQIRITPFQYQDAPQPVWTLDTGLYPETDDYSRVYKFKDSAPSSSTEALDSIVTTTPTQENTESNVNDQKLIFGSEIIQAAKSEFEKALFSTASRQLIYTEPNIYDSDQSYSDDIDKYQRFSIDEIVKSNKSYVINSKLEYGNTILCKRLEFELLLNGHMAQLRDATLLPRYKKKLEVALSITDPLPEKLPVLIIDNFDPNAHDGILQEITSEKWFSRIIIIHLNKPAETTENSKAYVLNNYTFHSLYLWGISRSDIRLMAKVFFDSNNDVLISSIVDKVYDDLLALCIPLTPPNVIMYLRVLSREEGEFYPINRVDIVGRYIADILRKSSDIYSENFNVKNKLDVISEFVYNLFQKKSSHFDDKYWYASMSEYKEKTLSIFDEKDFLTELLNARIFIRSGERIYVKYRFFFDFFLGRYLSTKPEILRIFLENNLYLTLPGSIEVLTGLSSDNEFTVSYISKKLEELLGVFSERYFNNSFDPLYGVNWPDNDSDDQAVWEPVRKNLESGPRSTSEIDAIKRSLTSESRTANQEVLFKEYKELEYNLFVLMGILTEAVRNSDDISGALKISSYELLLSSHLVGYQIGTVFSSMLAQHQYVRWGGIAFIGFNKAAVPSNIKESMFNVIHRLHMSVAKKASDALGSKKLGSVFKLREKNRQNTGFTDVINFACILHSKPSGYEDVLKKAIFRTGKNDYYLSTLLQLLMSHYRNEILKNRDRDSIKRLVATIQTKRTFNKRAPGEKAISKVLSKMEEAGKFQQKPLNS